MSGEFQTIWEQVRRQVPAERRLRVGEREYLRIFRPAERLILLGGGHIAQALSRYGAELGFAVTVADDRPAFANRTRFPEAGQVVCDDFQEALGKIGVQEQDYVCVLTRGHRYDADCLRTILAGPLPRYLGMIGSRRRVAALFQMLEGEGFPREALDRVHAPIGLDIGALTVREIAVSIAAQLIQCRREGTDRRSKSDLLTTEEVDLPLLQFLAEDPRPKALMTVVETQGSTPVKSGAMMAVTAEGATVGTIGGGCGEGAVLREAYRLIGTGQRRLVTVNMSNDVAEDEGMVCGGEMGVWIEDVGPGKE